MYKPHFLIKECSYWLHLVMETHSLSKLILFVKMAVEHSHSQSFCRLKTWRANCTQISHMGRALCDESLSMFTSTVKLSHVGIWLFQPALLCVIDMVVHFNKGNLNWNCDLCWSRWDDLSVKGPWGCAGVGWLIRVSQRSWGSFCGLQWLWWLSSLSQQTVYSAAAALSCRVATCAGQERPCRL